MPISAGPVGRGDQEIGCPGNWAHPLATPVFASTNLALAPVPHPPPAPAPTHFPPTLASIYPLTPASAHLPRAPAPASLRRRRPPVCPNTPAATTRRRFHQFIPNAGVHPFTPDAAAHLALNASVLSSIQTPASPIVGVLPVTPNADPPSVGSVAPWAPGVLPFRPGTAPAFNPPTPRRLDLQLLDWGNLPPTPLHGVPAVRPVTVLRGVIGQNRV